MHSHHPNTILLWLSSRGSYPYWPGSVLRHTPCPACETSCRSAIFLHQEFHSVFQRPHVFEIPFAINEILRAYNLVHNKHPDHYRHKYVAQGGRQYKHPLYLLNPEGLVRRRNFHPQVRHFARSPVAVKENNLSAGFY